MLRKIRGTIWPLALAGVALAFGVRSLDAQGATPETTVITNTATVSFTDANTNTYTDVTASVSVTVGFAASVLVTGPAGPENPVPGSTDNSVIYSVQNLGNGTDGVTIDAVLSAAGIITNLRYVYNTVEYDNLTDLNNQIAADLLLQDATITIEVLYDVAAGTGGQAVDLTFEATSTRDTNISDDVTTDLTPAESIAVAVTPDDDTETDRLPNSPTVLNYTATFTVTNNGDGPETFDLAGSRGNNGGTVAITIVSVNGGTATVGPIAAGGTASVDVVYTIADVVSVDTLYLAATSQTDGNVSDQGHFTFAVVRPALSVTKEVFRSDQATAFTSPPDSVVPDEVIWYKVTVENIGTTVAKSVQIADALPGELELLQAVGDVPAEWSITADLGADTVDADLNVDLLVGPTETRYIWIQAQVK